MNEGIAKALRRQARAEAAERGADNLDVSRSPGKVTKRLWQSLSHRERGQWRSRLPKTRAQRRLTQRLGFALVQRYIDGAILHRDIAEETR